MDNLDCSKCGVTLSPNGSCPSCGGIVFDEIIFETTEFTPEVPAYVPPVAIVTEQPTDEIGTPAEATPPEPVAAEPIPEDFSLDSEPVVEVTEQPTDEVGTPAEATPPAEQPVTETPQFCFDKRREQLEREMQFENLVDCRNSHPVVTPQPYVEDVHSFWGVLGAIGKYLFTALWTLAEVNSRYRITGRRRRWK